MAHYKYINKTMRLKLGLPR